MLATFPAAEVALVWATGVKAGVTEVGSWAVRVLYCGAGRPTWPLLPLFGTCVLVTVRAAVLVPRHRNAYPFGPRWQ